MSAVVESTAEKMPRVQGFLKGHDPRRSVAIRRMPNGKTLAQMAREHTMEAVNYIANVVSGLDDEGKPHTYKPGDRLRAAEILLDRGWGKAVSVVQMDVNNNQEIRTLTREALMALAQGIDPAQPVTIEGEVITEEAVDNAVEQEESS